MQGRNRSIGGPFFEQLFSGLTKSLLYSKCECQNVRISECLNGCISVHAQIYGVYLCKSEQSCKKLFFSNGAPAKWQKGGSPQEIATLHTPPVTPLCGCWTVISFILAAQCTNGMVYSECNKCPKTCQNMHERSVCQGTCVPGCSCPVGTVLHKDRCVQPSMCQCTHDGKEFKSGEYYVKDCNKW